MTSIATDTATSSTTRSWTSLTAATAEALEGLRKEEAAAAVGVVESAAEDAVQDVLGSFMLSNISDVVERSIPSEAGEIKVAAISPAAVTASGGSVAVSAGGENSFVKVEVSADVLAQAQSLSGTEGPVLMSVMIMVEDFAEKLQEPAAPPETGGPVFTLASKPLVIDLRGPDGARLQLGDLETPMLLQLETPNDTAICAYWDKDAAAWSTAGVRTLSAESGILQCETSHLSIFGAILQDLRQVLRCSTLTILLQPSALAKLSRTEYLEQGPTMVVLCACLLSFAGLFTGVCNDKQAEDDIPWIERESALLLTRDQGDVRARKSEDSASHEVEEAKQRRVSCCWSILGRAGDLSLWILSTLFLLEIEKGARLCLQLFRDPEASINYCIEALHASRSGVDVESIRVVLSGHVQQLERRKDRADQEPRPRRSLDIVSRIAQSVRRSLRRQDLVRAVESFVARLNIHGCGIWAVENFLSASPCRRILILFPAMHPWLVLTRFCAFTPASVRTALIVMKLFSAGFVNALFVGNGAQLLEADPGCQQQRTISQKLIIGVLSACVGDIVIAFAFLVQKRNPVEKAHWSPEDVAQQRKMWRRKRIMFWAVAVVYMSFCLFYILLFLANVSPTDGSEWLEAAAMSLLQDILLLPAALALGLGIITSVTFCCKPQLKQRVKDSWIKDEATESHAEDIHPRRDSCASSVEFEDPCDVQPPEGVEHPSRHEEIRDVDFSSLMPGMPS